MVGSLSFSPSLFFSILWGLFSIYWILCGGCVAIGSLKEEAMHCTEIDSADKKNWMSSAQLWSNGTTCDYKKEDSASEAKLVIF